MIVRVLLKKKKKRKILYEKKFFVILTHCTSAYRCKYLQQKVMIDIKKGLETALETGQLVLFPDWSPIELYTVQFR